MTLKTTLTAQGHLEYNPTPNCNTSQCTKQHKVITIVHMDVCIETRTWPTTVLNLICTFHPHSSTTTLTLNKAEKITCHTVSKYCARISFLGKRKQTQQLPSLYEIIPKFNCRTLRPICIPPYISGYLQPRFHFQQTKLCSEAPRRLISPAGVLRDA